MQYTKPMIDLVYEIRRRVDANMKPSVKMANPDVLKELADHYQITKDTITKTLIKELLTMAGDEWRQLLEPTPLAIEPPKQVVKVYRGQTILVEAPQRSELLVADITPEKPVRMYRGHRVIV
ncbi:hypothetical protein [Cellvibrio sp. UBA7661]|uniref:hypothetical protein n=1 Tax=Cellvibrio sp. UBA7661 TaxID=1946311 RepID=UPI002F35DF20